MCAILVFCFYRLTIFWFTMGIIISGKWYFASVLEGFEGSHTKWRRTEDSTQVKDIHYGLLDRSNNHVRYETVHKPKPPTSVSVSQLAREVSGTGWGLAQSPKHFQIPHKRWGDMLWSSSIAYLHFSQLPAKEWIKECHQTSSVCSFRLTIPEGNFLRFHCSFSKIKSDIL